MTHSILLVAHILSGAVALASGAAAMTFRKGSARHRKAGNVFVVSMMAMAASGIYVALVIPVMLSVVGGALTLYLVATAWASGARRPDRAGGFEIAALVAALTIGAGAIMFGVEALHSETGLKDGFPAGGYFFFGSVALLAGAGDARLVLRRAIPGKHRVARHLWRMGFALFIASSAFFLGQAQLFPAFIRRSQVLLIPGYLPLLLLVYWLIRVLLGGRWTAVLARSPEPIGRPLRAVVGRWPEEENG
jgi:hypothetical protein